jgi:hypothetical protein
MDKSKTSPAGPGNPAKHPHPIRPDLPPGASPKEIAERLNSLRDRAGKPGSPKP